MRASILAILNEKGEVRDFEAPFRLRGGELRTATVSMAPIEMDGEPCLLTQIVELSDLRKAQEALRASEQHYRTLVESSEDVIVRMDREGPDSLCQFRRRPVAGLRATRVDRKTLPGSRD